jgi:hypothetical protein
MAPKKGKKEKAKAPLVGLMEVMKKIKGLPGGKAMQSEYSVPSNIAQRKPMFTRFAGKPAKIAGRDVEGIRVEGHQVLCTLTAANAISGLLVAITGGATVRAADAIDLSPDNMNARLAGIANWFEKYKFRKLRVYYVPRVAATEVGQAVWAIDRDASASATPGFVANGNLATSCLFQLRTPCDLELNDPSDMIYYNKFSNATSADARTTTQAVLRCNRDETTAITTLFGTVMVEYVVDFYYPTASQSITISAPEGRISITDSELGEALAMMRSVSKNKLWPKTDVLHPDYIKL